MFKANHGLGPIYILIILQWHYVPAHAQHSSCAIPQRLLKNKRLKDACIQDIFINVIIII